MSLVPILQNIAQLQGLYKEKEAWKTILGNCDSLVYLGGNDEDTFKFMSGLLGKQTIDVRNTSRSFGQTGSGSLSHQKIARDLMTPDEVGNMKRHELNAWFELLICLSLKAKNTIQPSIQTGST